MWNEIRELFPVHESCVYLNNAGVSPPSIRVLEALEAYHACHARHGCAELFTRYRHTGKRIKEILGALLSCPPDTLALTRNTSEGMNIVAQGLDWNPGDIVLGLHHEYPANVYPWWNLEEKGVVFRQLPSSACPSDFSLLEQGMNDRVRLVTVSGVNWCTGHVVDLDRLGRLCSRRNALLVVDVAQSLGVVPQHPERAGVSAMSGSAWKWLMGPLGVGIFYCRPDLMQRLRTVFVGTDTVVDAWNYLDYRFTPKPDASRFEFSTGNFNDWVYLLAALELLQEIGFPAVRERILQLNDHLRQGLENRGYEVLCEAPQGTRSGITTFRRPGMEASREVSRLGGEKIFVAERNGGVRVSPHIFNNEEDLDRLLEFL